MADSVSVVLREQTGNHAPRPLAVRVAGVMLLAGGALAAATALLPPPAEGSDAIVLAAGAVAIGIGLYLLLARPVLGDHGLGLLLVIGTALITVATREGGASGGAADNEILFLWICLYAFYFLALPYAVLQIGIVGVAYGALLIEQEPEFNEAATRWLVTMTTLLLAGIVISHLRSSLYATIGKLSAEAATDSLTGLLNRGALTERFELERARSIRDGTPLSVLAVDVDSFKPLNDTLGHPSGDQVLLQVSAALRNWTRQVDAVARIGGDEFAVLLPATSAADAIAIAGDLRSAIARTPGPENLRVTVSVGVTTTEAPAPSFQELWQAADAAMYEAKRSGGDRSRFRELGAPAAEAGSRTDALGDPRSG